MKKIRLISILFCLLAALALSSCMGREGADITTPTPLTTTVCVTDEPVPNKHRLFIFFGRLRVREKNMAFYEERRIKALILLATPFLLFL